MIRILKRKLLLPFLGTLSLIISFGTMNALPAQAKKTPKIKIVRLHKMPKSFWGTWHYYDQYRHQFANLRVAPTAVQENQNRISGKNLVIQKIKMAGHVQYSFFSKKQTDDCAGFALYHKGKVRVNGHYHQAIILARQAAFLPFKTKARVTVPKAEQY